MIVSCALRGQPGTPAPSLASRETPAATPAAKRPHPWLAISLGYDHRQQDDQSVDVRGFVSGLLTNNVRTAADEIALVSLGRRSVPSEPSITSFQGSMAYLQGQAPALTMTDKRNILSVTGFILRRGNSPSIAHNPDPEAIFQNALARGPDGGICGDIHGYLSRAESALGLEASGTHTGVWKEWLGTSAGGWHVVSHFRDPQTGEYYMQNYENIYATGQNTLQNLVEVSSRILGYTWRSSVNSRPGIAHAYVPRFSRWLWGSVEAQALDSVAKPWLTGDLTNRSQTLAAQYGRATARHQLKLFGVASRFDAEEGNYGFRTAGASYVLKTATTARGMGIDEMGVDAGGYAGLLQFETPVLRPGADPTRLEPTPWSHSSVMFGAHGRAFLRRGNTVAACEGLAMSATGQSKRQEFHFGVTHEFKNVPVSLTVQRACDIVFLNHRERLDVAYDRLGATLNLWSDHAFSVRLMADGYALGGLDHRNGWAGRTGAELSLETRKHGTFSLGGEWGKVLENTANDPFYALPASRYANLGWRFPLKRLLTLAIQTSYGEGPAIQPFATFGVITPELDDGSARIRGAASINFAF